MTLFSFSRDGRSDLDLDVVGMLEPLRIPRVVLVNNHFPLADRYRAFRQRSGIHIGLQDLADDIFLSDPAVKREDDALRPDDYEDVVALFDIVLLQPDLECAILLSMTVLRVASSISRPCHP